MCFSCGMKIESTKVNLANQHLQNMVEKVISTPDYPADKFYGAVRRRAFEYQCINQVSVAGEKLSELAKKFLDMGKLDFAGIICSMISKFRQLPFEIREKYVLQAIDVAERQDDKIHVVARLEDLHREYAERDDVSKLLKILTKEENALKDIIEDFDGARKKFRTLIYQNDNVENYEDLLATIQVDIAKIVMRRKPKKASQKLNSAKEIFKKLGDSKSYEFAEKMLERAEHLREMQKASKRNRH